MKPKIDRIILKIFSETPGSAQLSRKILNKTVFSYKKTRIGRSIHYGLVKMISTIDQKLPFLESSYFLVLRKKMLKIKFSLLALIVTVSKLFDVFYLPLTFGKTNLPRYDLQIKRIDYEFLLTNLPSAIEEVILSDQYKKPVPVGFKKEIF